MRITRKQLGKANHILIIEPISSIFTIPGRGFSLRTKTPLLADRILDAAAQLFASQFYHEARMDDIAAEAGVSKGTLYSYFHDKDEMYMALLARASAGMVQTLELAVARQDGARAKLTAIVDAILTYFDGQPHVFDLIQHVEVLRRGAEFPWQKARDVGLRLVLAVFEEGRANGEFHVAAPETASLLLFGGLRSVIRFGTKPRPRGLAELIVDSFLHGASART
jgi:AcrR family transcriptional regulator